MNFFFLIQSQGKTESEYHPGLLIVELGAAVLPRFLFNLCALLPPSGQAGLSTSPFHTACLNFTKPLEIRRLFHFSRHLLTALLCVELKNVRRLLSRCTHHLQNECTIFFLGSSVGTINN